MLFPPSGPRCECGARSNESITCGVIANIEPHGMTVRSSWPSKSESPWIESYNARLELTSVVSDRMRRMYRRRRGLSSSGSSNSAWSTPTMLSPATEHPPGANNNSDNKSNNNNNNNKPNLGLLGASGLSGISPNGVTDGHVTSPEEIEENDKDGGGGDASDYFGSRGGGGAGRE